MLSLAAELDAPAESAVFHAYREIDAAKAGGQTLILEGPQSARAFLNGRELALWLRSAEVSKRLELDLPLEAGRKRLLCEAPLPPDASQAVFCRFPAPADVRPGRAGP